MSEWRTNSGEAFPLDPETVVEVRFTTGRTDKGKAKCFYFAAWDIERIQRTLGEFVHRVTQWRTTS